MLIQPKQVPLLGVFLSLIALAGVAPTVVRPLPAARAADTGTEMAVGTDAQEAVLARYAALRDLLRAGKDRDALALWVTLEGQPIAIQQNSDERGPIGSLAPASLFYQLGDEMIRRAQTQAEAGNRIDAGRWLGRCEELIYRVLTSPSATPESDKALQILARMTGRAAAKLGIRPGAAPQL